MNRPFLAIALATLVAAVVVPAALAVRVHVRVEGKTQTIFGATEPRLNVAESALDALEAASVRGEFYYHVTQSGIGSFIDQIGRYRSTATGFWLYKVNGALGQVAADKLFLRNGDRVLWYWAPFSEAVVPTLRLVRQRRGCYRVLKEDDAGRATAAIGAVIRVDGRRVRTRGGRACIGPHRGLVRATLTGAIRSNAVR